MQGVALAGNYAYVANGESGLSIIDVSDPTAPTEAGFYDTGYACGVAVAASRTLRNSPPDVSTNSASISC